MDYLYIKSLHLIFMVSWFAGLFYLVRLFIYHTEANEKPEAEKKILHEQFSIMEKRLWSIITNPAMLLTIASGVYLLCLAPGFLQEGWMHIKLTFVFFLIGYSHYCKSIMKKLANGTSKWTSSQLRIWNEVATIFLVSIVFLVVLKNSFSWIWGTVGLIIFSIGIMSAVKIYKLFRNKK